MDNTTNIFTNPFNLPPAIQITLPLSVARNLLTLLEECASTWSVDTEAVQVIRREYTNEMVRHGIIRPSERSVMTPDEDYSQEDATQERQAWIDSVAKDWSQREIGYSQEDATQGEYDADNAWLRSAGWGEM